MTTAGASVPVLARLVPPLPAPGPPRPWRALVLGVPRRSRRSPCCCPSAADLRPVGVADLGPRHHPGGPRHRVAGRRGSRCPCSSPTVFSLLGDDVAPTLWLIVARAGGLLALAMAFRLAARLGGRAAGSWPPPAWRWPTSSCPSSRRGNSEGLLVGLVAVGGRAPPRRPPGATPSCSAPRARCCARRCGRSSRLYGLWLMLAERASRAGRTRRARARVAARPSALLWFVPEYIGSGNLLRAARARWSRCRTRRPRPRSRSSRCSRTRRRRCGRRPTRARSSRSCSRWRRVRRDPRAAVVLALAAALHAADARGGRARRDRLHGQPALRRPPVGAGLRAGRRGLGVAGRARARAPRGGRGGGRRRRPARRGDPLRAAHRATRGATSCATRESEMARAADLPAALAAAGGRDAVLRCGTPRTGPFETQLVAWHLRRAPARGRASAPSRRPRCSPCAGRSSPASRASARSAARAGGSCGRRAGVIRGDCLEGADLCLPDGRPREEREPAVRRAQLSRAVQRRPRAAATAAWP